MKKTLLLSTACVALCVGIITTTTRAEAQQEMGSLTYYDVPASEYIEHHNEWRVFLEYHLHREQCQNYVPPPPGFVMKGCHVYRVEANVPVATTAPSVETMPAPEASASVPVTASYTVHFGFNKSAVPANEEKVLDNVARDIQKYSPAAVTVSGYASTPGSDGHNQALSERRAETVTQELTNRGVNASIISQAAYGETHLAVPTGDNVRMPPNRRVVIEFNH